MYRDVPPYLLMQTPRPITRTTPTVSPCPSTPSVMEENENVVNGIVVTHASSTPRQTVRAKDYREVRTWEEFHTLFCVLLARANRDDNAYERSLLRDIVVRLRRMTGAGEGGDEVEFDVAALWRTHPVNCIVILSELRWWDERKWKYFSQEEVPFYLERSRQECIRRIAVLEGRSVEDVEAEFSPPLRGPADAREREGSGAASRLGKRGRESEDDSREGGGPCPSPVEIG
jgi:hypothetical protein